MTEAAAILEVRHVRLAEQATLQPATLAATSTGTDEDGVFVALDDPPPVRTVLTVVEGDRRRALEVAWVVEVADRDAVRGFYGRWVGDDALERAAKVGTEHLEDGTPVVQPVVPDNSLSMDVSDAVMAMPAPVMIVDDDTGVVDASDRDEDDDGEEAVEAAAGAKANADTETAAGTDAAADTEASTEDEADADDEAGAEDEADAGDEAASDEADAGDETAAPDQESAGSEQDEGKRPRGRKKRGRRRK